MTEQFDLKNEEIRPGEKTTGDFLESKQKEATTSASTFTNEQTNEPTQEYASNGENKNLSPADFWKTEHYKKEGRKNDAKTALFNVLKIFIPTVISVIVGILAILGGIWAYKLNNIAEPIGGIKANIQNLQNENQEIKSDMEKIEDRLNGFLETNATKNR